MCCRTPEAINKIIAENLNFLHAKYKNQKTNETQEKTYKKTNLLLCKNFSINKIII